MRLFLTLIAALTFTATTMAQTNEYGTSQSYNKFGFNLFAHMPASGNQVISSFSVYSALAMTYAGASTVTAAEMGIMLDADTITEVFFENNKSLIDRILQKKEVEINIANATWLNKDFNLEKDFKKVSEEYFQAKSQQLSFETPESMLESQNIINNWVSKKTKTKIPNLIKDGMLSKDTRLVLTNAIYFKGDWEMPFAEDQTMVDTFFTGPEVMKQTKMMHSGGQFYYYSNDKFSAVSLPYQLGECMMHIVLPNEAMYDSLNSFFTYKDYKEMIDSLQKSNVKMTLPKFSFESENEMSEYLKIMGMPSAFDNAADFSKLTGTKDTRIDKVFHKTIIEVNEKGTEASAATAVVVVRKTTIRMENKEFKANRPFLFFITEAATGTILFMGNVLNP